MTRWKDLLPEHEPENDSWEKLEKSLHLEEQLQRELPNLPLYKPREHSWDRVAAHLPAKVRRFTGYYSAAAAVILILALSATFYFTQKTRISKNHPPGGTISYSVVRPAEKSSEVEKHSEPAGKIEQTGELSSYPNEAPVVENSDPAEVTQVKFVVSTRLKPKVTPNIIAGRTGPPADSARLIAPHSKRKVGHHRVIQVQWKTSKKNRLKLARLPAEATDSKPEVRHHLIQIKL